MQRLTSLLALAFAAMLTLAFIQPAIAGEMGAQSMVGTVDKDARFVTPDGDEYLIVGDMAEDVIVKQGEKLKVTGEIRTEGDGKAIAVKDYKVLDDYEFQQEMEKQKMKKKDM